MGRLITAAARLRAIEKKLNTSPTAIIVFCQDLDNQDLFYLAGNNQEKLTRTEIARRYPDNKNIIIYVTYYDKLRGNNDQNR